MTYRWDCDRKGLWSTSTGEVVGGSVDASPFLLLLGIDDMVRPDKWCVVDDEKYNVLRRGSTSSSRSDRTAKEAAKMGEDWRTVYSISNSSPISQRVKKS